jgi:uncharacterized protein YbaR (Trm112 family)
MVKELDEKMLELLVCPLTKQPLTYDRKKRELVSPAAKLAFPIHQGIPILVIDEARKIEK